MNGEKKVVKKIPYRILPKNNHLLVMAGIWDIWDREGYPVKSFSIITTSPNREVAPLHNRMPVLLTNREEQQGWLEDQPIEDVLGYLHPPPDQFLHIYRVSTELNSPKNNSPSLHEEIPENLDLFSQR
jgi:putative SOS response-associated peptidase YedK